MVQVTMTVDDREVREGMKRIERKLKGRIIRQSVQAGGGIIKRALIAAAPVDTGSMKKSIFVVMKYRGRFAVVGPRTDKVFTFKRTKKGRWRKVGKKTRVTSADTTTRRRPSKYAHLTEGGRQSYRPYIGSRWMSRAAKSVQAAAAAKVIAKMKQMIEQA